MMASGKGKHRKSAETSLFIGKGEVRGDSYIEGALPTESGP